MVIFWLWLINIFLLTQASKVAGVTHWVVTENGKIEANLESPFTIRRPYDLLALLDQEKRVDDVNSKYEDLMNRQKSINDKLYKLKHISKFKLDDYECLSKEKKLSSINFYMNVALVENKINTIKISNGDKSVELLEEPDCEKFSSLQHGVLQIDNLESIKNYANISLVPDISLEKLLASNSINIFANDLVKALSKNSSSWLHYNLAALYWRMKNVGPKALECSRRSIYYVNEYYQDIPLHMMAGVLHQARHSEDAAKILLSAVKLAPDQPAHFLALGSVYASMAEYHKSIVYYDKYLKIKPDQDVIAMKHAALCLWKLENDLWKLENEVSDMHKFFQSILSDLNEYQRYQVEWVKLQEHLLWEHASFEKQLGSLSDQGAQFLLKSNKMCIKKLAQNPNKFISCDPTKQTDSTDFEELDIQELLNFIEDEKKSQSHKYALKAESINNIKNSATDDDNIVNFKKENVNRLKADGKKFYFDDLNWPPTEDCMKWDFPANELKDFSLPVFLPPEHKGYNIEEILSDKINIKKGDEHKLPWYPPSCDDWISAEHEKLIPHFEKLTARTELSDDVIKSYLLRYVNGGKTSEAEIGQRIITAMEMKVAPSWLLSTLASLYWRVRDNHKKALDCLNVALNTISKQEPKEIVLVSIASIASELGYYDEAFKYASEAYDLDDSDVSTNFFLAVLNYKKNKLLRALYYLKNVLRVDSSYSDGKAELLLKIWSCQLKMGALTNIPTELQHNINEKTCTKKDSTNDGVICSVNGEHYKTAAIQCFRTDKMPMKGIDINSPKIKQNCGKKSDQDHLYSSSDVLDKSISELLEENSHQALHMRLSLDDNLGSTVSVAVIEDPVPEALLHLYEKSLTLLLSPLRCRDIKNAEWVYFTSMWQSIATRNVDIGYLLKPLTKPLKESMKPYCSKAALSIPNDMKHFTASILKNRLPNSPEKALMEWLGLMAGDQKASIKELGAKIGIALKENTTSWILANAAAIYWRIIGNTEEAVFCLRQALAYVPYNMRDVPLVSLANILNRVGYHHEALDAAYAALKSHPDFVFNHFTAGNIHTAMGDFEKAISFYRASLTLDANFAPARNRLLAISCTLLYDESGALRDTAGSFDNS